MALSKVYAKKSNCGDGHVQLHVSMNLYGHGKSLKMDGRVNLSTDEARTLAASLITFSDQADAKVKAKNAADERRQKWRDREVAAGRMRIIRFGAP